MLKNRLTYLMVVLTFLFFIYLYEDPKTYLAFYAVLILPILSLLMSYMLKFTLVTTAKMSDEFLPKEQDSKLVVSVKNNFFLSCSCAYIRLESERLGLELDTQKKYFSIPAKKSCEFEFGIRGNYRGVYEIKLEAFFYDMLGIFKFKSRQRSKNTITIAPKIIPIPLLNLETSTHEASTSRSNRVGEDYTTFSELRAFQLTDSYRQIHWKASAKRDQLISKNFEGSVRQTASFFVDNSFINPSSHKGLEQEDLMMDYVISTINQFYHLGYSVSLQSLGREAVELTRDFIRLYEEAASIRFLETNKISNLLNEYLNSGRETLNLFIFIQDVNEELLLVLQSLVLNGHQITLFLFEDANQEYIKKLIFLEVRIIYFEDKFQKIA